MHLGLSFNVKHTKPSKNIAAQKEADFDDPETIAAIKQALEAGGHTVYEIEANQQAYSKFVNLKNKINIVFNFAEGLHGDSREAHIPSFLEMLEIPYTHSGPLTQAISLDKALTKIVLLHHNLPTPNFQLVKDPTERLRTDLNFPLIVKPNAEGSSIGIFNDNLVYDRIKLHERVQWLFERFRQPVLIEEYINGREFTVSILGNNPPIVLPIVEQNFAVFPENIPHFASYEAKWLFEDELPNPQDAYFCPAQLTPKLREKIENICLNTYKILNCKDVSRIDLRMDKHGNVYVIEINTLPGMIPDENVISYLPVAARKAGFSFEGLVNTILNEGCKRYGIDRQKKTYHSLKNYWPRQYASLQS